MSVSRVVARLGMGLGTPNHLELSPIISSNGSVFDDDLSDTRTLRPNYSRITF